MASHWKSCTSRGTTYSSWMLLPYAANVHASHWMSNAAAEGEGEGGDKAGPWLWGSCTSISAAWSRSLMMMPCSMSDESGKSGPRCTACAYTLPSRYVIHCCRLLPAPVKPMSNPPAIHQPRHRRHSHTSPDRVGHQQPERRGPRADRQVDEDVPLRRY